MFKNIFIFTTLFITTSYCGFSDFSECLRDTTGGGLNIDQDLFIYTPADLSQNIADINSWRKSICTEHVRPQVHKFERVLENCIKTHGYQESVRNQELKLTKKFTDFCESEEQNIVCHEVFQINLKNFTYNYFNNSFCNSHLGLYDYLKQLHSKCPQKFQTVDIQRGEFVYQQFLDLAIKDDNLTYFTYEQCVEMNKPIVYYSENYYGCVFNCSMKNKRQSAASQNVYMDFNEYCNDVSFHLNKKSCFDECKDEHPKLAEKSIKDIQIINDLCSNNGENMKNCKISKRLLDKVPKCSNIQYIKEKINLKCNLNSEEIDALMEDFIYTWSNKDIQKFMYIKDCDKQSI